MHPINENKLETLLRLAADEPAHRPEFYNLLMDSEVFILGNTSQAGDSDPVTLEAGDHIQIKHWEKQDRAQIIPFFTSLERLQKALESEETYVALPARSLFEMTLGATLFINPKSDYGKEFIPQEIEQLLSNGMNQAAVQRTTEKETSVLMGQPSNYPTHMVESLNQLLAKHSHVEKAYLALMHDASVDEKPHLIIGIEASGDIEKVIREAGIVAADSASDGEVVDLYRVNADDSGLSQYFINDTIPFYERKLGTRLKSWFGIGNA